MKTNHQLIALSLCIVANLAMMCFPRDKSTNSAPKVDESLWITNSLFDLKFNHADPVGFVTFSSNGDTNYVYCQTMDIEATMVRDTISIHLVEGSEITIHRLNPWAIPWLKDPSGDRIIRLAEYPQRLLVQLPDNTWMTIDRNH